MIVYYGEQDNNLLTKPNPVLSFVETINSPPARINKCPAFIDYYRNVFAICPTFDYLLNYKKDSLELSSKSYGQEYFNKYVLPRDLANGIFSYFDPLLYLVPDSDDVMLEQFNLAYPFEAPNYSLVPGIFNAGKHIRPLELSIKVTEDTDLQFKRDKPIYLIRFKTEEKVIFKRFKVTSDFLSIVTASSNIRLFTRGVRSLNFYYKLSKEYKLKKQLLDLAKQNVID